MNATEYVDRVRCRRLLDEDPANAQGSQIDSTSTLDSEIAAKDFQTEPSDIRTLGLVELVLKKRKELPTEYCATGPSTRNCYRGYWQFPSPVLCCSASRCRSS